MKSWQATACQPGKTILMNVEVILISEFVILRNESQFYKICLKKFLFLNSPIQK